MAAFGGLVSALRRAEQQLERQLDGVRTAISSLEMGSAVSPAVPARGAIALRAGGVVRKRRRLSAAARKRISDAQKKRWAKQRAETKR
jgi:hypothetical protein